MMSRQMAKIGRWVGSWLLAETEEVAGDKKKTLRENDNFLNLR